MTGYLAAGIQAQELPGTVLYSARGAGRCPGLPEELSLLPILSRVGLRKARTLGSLPRG